MKISTRGRYALRMMLDVTRHGGEKAPVSLASVSERTAISHGYLEQVALALRSAGLVRGVAGRHGGYKLAAPAHEISIRRIIEATIGPICVVDCIDEPEACLRSDYCECRVVYALINQRIGEVLDEFSLADLADPKWLHDTAGAFTSELIGITPGEQLK
ncbi:MAG: Rrf2 family transcriptional regulator [Acidobacteriota bacterium]|nr:Rrf2 family transcriptional regulator [Acidobacteriota bacterium]